MRPSELYGITWPLAAFFLDRGVYRWAKFVDGKVNEAGDRVRHQMRKERNAEMFINSARTVAYNKLMGLSVASAYRSPDSFISKKAEEPKQVVSVAKIKTLSGESNDVDWAAFNK